MVPDCSVLVLVGSDLCMYNDLSVSRIRNTALVVPATTGTDQSGILSLVPVPVPTQPYCGLIVY